MIEALDLEVAAVRKRGTGTQIEVHGGEYVGRAEGNWLYRFLVMEDLHLRDDTPIRLECGDKRIAGVIVSFRDGALLVAVEADLGGKIASARLVADDSFLIERLKDRLQKVRSGEAQFQRMSAERVIGQASIRTGETEPPSVVLQGDGRLNNEQCLAIRRSLGSETAFVWGPPGTGKTTTLARIVEGHYRSGRSVLLVSNTNIAVDTALEKVAERLQGETEFHNGAVLRKGPVVKEELRTRFGPQVILEEVVARLGARLQHEKAQLEGQARPLEEEERYLAKVMADLERLAHLRHTLEEAQSSLTVARNDFRVRTAEAEQHHANAARLRTDLARAREMGTIRRLFAGLNPEKLEREINAAERAAISARDAAGALTKKASELEIAAGRIQAEVSELAQVTRPYPPSEKCKERRVALQQSLKGIRQRITEIENELAKLAEEIVGRCRILATTVYRTYIGSPLSRKFDVVVIDEASMLMLPLAYYAAGLAEKAVTVAGDFRQLPPIVTSDEQVAAEWLKRDVFEKAKIPERIGQHAPTPELVTLQVQYRMREPICDVVNQLFYADRPLHTDSSATASESRFPLGEASLLYVDTAPFHPWTSLRVGTYSRYNLFHALLVRNIVLYLAEVGYLPGGDRPNDAVGAVAPYAAQARLIQALIQDRLGLRAGGIAATVHRFQGNEKNTMLIDLTDSIGARLGRFLQATRIEEDGARLLNVAISRPKHHLVLIANFEFLRAKSQADGIVRRLLGLFDAEGEALEVEGLLPLADRDWVDGLGAAKIPAFDLPDGAAGAFSEGTFYPAFLKDLHRATSFVVIFSPFITGNGTSRWVDSLRAIIGKGVGVRFVTRPPTEAVGTTPDEAEELIRELRKLGIVVDLRASMHEKVAIIDDRILWHGSLNILSHRDTHESMLRIESPNACAQVVRFLSTPLGRNEGAPIMHEAENPPCPVCGGLTVWCMGQYGIYFKCARSGCNGKVDPRRGGWRPPRLATSGGTGSREPNKRIRKSNRGDSGGKCPHCGGSLVQRNGQHGPFLGCSNFRNGCRYTENVA